MPNPLIEFDPNGRAPILSYDVPEPTTYSGKNFIEIQVPQDWFASPTRAPIKPGTVTPLPPAPKGVSIVGSTQPAVAVSSSAIVGTPLLSIGEAARGDMPGAVVHQRYRSMSGGIASRSYAAKAEGVAPVGSDREVLDPVLHVASPSASFQFTQAGSQARITVSGTVRDPLVNYRVTVRVGSNPKVFATEQPNSVPKQIRWSATVSAPAGSVVLHVAYELGAEVEQTLDVRGFVTLTPGAADVVAPTLVIQEPAFGASVEAPSAPASVRIRGGASDATQPSSGVAAVEVSVNGEAFAPASQVQGGWASWLADLSLPVFGAHDVLVRVRDIAGNQSTQRLQLRLIKKAPKRKVARLLIAESLRLSTFPGDYGAGRTVSTFSLLPGEKVRLSIKTFQKTVTTQNDTTSLFDSFTQESADDFEGSIEAEQAHKENYDESFKYSVSGEAQAQWGWGSAKISAGVSGGTNSAREEAGRNVMRSASKHAAKASSKRDVQVTKTVQTSTEVTQENEFIREFENINRSRTLNYVFRQLNQEYLSLLHLVDVRIGFYELLEGETTGVYTEAALPQLDSFLRRILVLDQVTVDLVKQSIIHQLNQVFDHEGAMRQVITDGARFDGNGAGIPGTDYLRFNSALTSDYVNPVSGEVERTVPGVIINADRFVLRTSALIVDALLGRGESLDDYAKLLQAETARQRRLENDKTERSVAADVLREKIVSDGDTDRAELYERLYELPVAPVAD